MSQNIESRTISEANLQEKYIERGNVVLRQEMKSLTPKCDANCAIIFFSILCILFLFFGVPILIAATKIVEFSLDYTNCISDDKGYCTLNFSLDKTIPQPVFLYYEINNFYMNHRDFVKSRSFPQLRGDIHVDSSNNSKCEGARYIHEIFDNDTSKYFTYTGHPLKGDDYANPCGLIAKSFFNDSEYTLVNSKNFSIDIDDTDIANEYDRKYMFKRHQDSALKQWMDVENQHFIVWMQMESFQNFRKLWGKITKDLESDNYSIKVKNNYNVISFNGRKLIILTNSSPIGTGSFFGYTLILGSGFSFLMAVVIYVLKIKYKNKTYTINDLKWK